LRVKVEIQTGAPLRSAQRLAGRDVAERLAGAGAGLRQHQVRNALDLPRLEGGGGGRGVVGLLRPLLRPLPQDVAQARPRLGRRDALRGGGRRRGRFLPFRQAAPDAQRVEGGLRAGLAEGGENALRPGPAGGIPHPGGERGGVAVERQAAPGREVAQHPRRHLRQQGGHRLVIRGRVHLQRQGEASRRRRGRAGRHAEGEQLQQVAGRLEGRDAEAPGGGRRMDEQGRRAVEVPVELHGRHAQHLPLRRQQDGGALAGDQCGGCGQEKPRSWARGPGSRHGHGGQCDGPAGTKKDPGRRMAADRAGRALALPPARGRAPLGAAL
jgi:hypothetical protein